MKGSTTLLKEAWTNSLEHFGLFAQLYSIPIFLPAVASLFIGLLDLGPNNESAVLILTVAASIAIFILSVTGSVAFIKAISEPEMTTFSSGYSFGLSRLGPYLFSVILASIAVIAGLFLFIIPGLLFALWFIFVPFIAALEGKGVMDSLKTSISYSKGNLVPIAVRILFILLITVIISALFQLPILAYFGSSTLTATFLGLFVTFLLSILSMNYMYLLYKEVKNKAEFSFPINTALE